MAVMSASKKQFHPEPASGQVASVHYFSTQATTSSAALLCQVMMLQSSLRSCTRKQAKAVSACPTCCIITVLSPSNVTSTFMSLHISAHFIEILTHELCKSISLGIEAKLGVARTVQGNL